MMTKPSLRPSLSLIVPSVLLLLAALLHLRLLPLSNTLEWFERQNLDLCFRLRGPLPADSSVVLVTIDDASLMRVGAWPWPRHTLARLLQNILAAQPRLVVLDVILPARPEEAAGTAELARVMRDSRMQGGAGVILPYYFSRISRQPVPDSEPPPAPVAASALILFDAPPQEVARLPWLHAAGLNHASLDLLSASLPGGHINLISTEAGGGEVVRWEAQIVRYGGYYLPALPLQIAAQAEQLTRGQIRLQAGQGIQLGERFIPTDRAGCTLINYYGPAGRFRQISAVEFLQGRAPALAGKIVLVGVTAAGTQDFLASPFASRLPGVEKLATSTANILRQEMLQRPDYLVAVEILLMFAAGMLAFWGCRRWPQTPGAVLLAGLALLLWVLGFAAFAGGRLWLHSLGLALAPVLTGGSTLLLAEKKKGPAASPVVPSPSTAVTEVITDRGGLRRLGRFEIIAEAGAGAMGKIYAAIDPTIGRKVAIKILHPMPGLSPAGRQRMRERFLREARAAGSLNHPNIVTIHQADEAAGHFFIVMEFLEGEPLDEMLEQQAPLPLPRLHRLTTQVASALDYAHSRGVVHRDIKPSNLMILAGDTVKILDFGIAHLAQSTLTQEGAVLGTPCYMSPEQLRGEKIDGRADVFSLAAVVYEMATRQRPFAGDNVAAISTQILAGRLTRPTTLNPRLPAAFDEILLQALHPDRERRYATAGAFAAALQRLL
ncbi:MAG: serine/threonine-protein kinase [candidate division KSB1 bacterium]|nr:serine/threonine-protein kinase [candidate division KSB1 bacterium]MDZ7288147.1 serine/threonine-protein kinase [candidate division KSB1 bacterium]MDZ7300340.1 serine/threonine-protein kinase [candidate division KSB1 bacterium]MDZ7306153.1 serine/threonine-protein kinase [candidate division KSB1 bacterium]MDZ7351340.1 serine/threonine-protein kinase [candidate division KSB1 bacterium]